MAKSIRSKREKRLRALRRDIVQPFYDNKDAAKIAAQEAALAAPKLATRSADNSSGTTAMDMTASAASSTSATMDVEMTEGNQNLKPRGGIGKKKMKKIKIARRKNRGKGKIRRKHV
ncbi:uncharacterized protein LOC127795398 [Diospyros lotus]|uniref:uncharacterized protein LOC127795398 n=1 Tax=Diospyros lotus TaxID=55363 RepID=UPI002255EACF|nr:uncharacterized protein LOC127795398 [Diospyros lotus]